MRSRIILLVCVLLMMQTMIAAPSKTSYWFQRAEEAYGKEDLDECLQFCCKGVEENPKDGYCWAIIAEIYSKRAYARYADALEAAEKALAFLPKKDKQWIGFTHNVCGEVYYKVGDFERSIEAYKTSLAYYPNDGRIRYGLADVYREMKRYEEANKELQILLDQTPAEPVVWAAMAYNCIDLNDLASAKKHVRMSLALKPDENAEAHIASFRIAMREKNFPRAAAEQVELLKAMAFVDEVLDSLKIYAPELLVAATQQFYEMSPTDAAHMGALASVYNRVGDNIHALVWEKRASDQDESFLLRTADLFAEFGMWEEADAAYRKVLKQDSSNNFNYAMMHSIKGDHEQALTLLIKDIGNEPEDAVNYRLAGRELMMLNRPNEALAYMDTAVVLADEDEVATAVFNRGEVYQRLGRTDEAQQDYLLAEQVAESKLTAVYIAALLGQKDVVDQYADSVLQGYTDWVSLSVLADIYACLKDTGATLMYMQKAIDKGLVQYPTQAVYRYDFLGNDSRWQDLVVQLEHARMEGAQKVRTLLAAEADTAALTEIPFTIQGGICQVKCAINGLPLYFIFDTGASTVSISNIEANFMLRNGYLNEADFMGRQNYVTATGEIHEGTVINLREVRVGDIVLKNIQASVVKNQHAPLLLGQSVFRRFGTVEVDNNAQVIRFVK